MREFNYSLIRENKWDQKNFDTILNGHTGTLFTPLAPNETPDALDRLCEEYNRVFGNMELEPLIAIPIFIFQYEE